MEEHHPWRVLKNWLTFRPWQRHSLVLMVGGNLYLIFGIALIVMSEELTIRQELHLISVIEVFTITIWGIIFIMAGLLASLSAKWPKFSDSWGYALLTGISSAWSAIYFLGWFFEDVPSRLSLLLGFAWGMIAFLWWAISGLTNPDRRLVVRDGDT